MTATHPPSTTDRDDTGTVIRLFQLLIVASLVGIGLFYRALEIESADTIGVLCWGIVITYVWTVWSWYRVTGVLFDWYLIFVTAAFTFNGGQAFLEVAYLDNRGVLDGEFSADTLMKTLYLVLISLAALHLGALDGIGRSTRYKRNQFADTTTPQVLTSLRLVGTGLLIVSLPFTGMLLKEAISVVLSGGYFSLYQQKAATGVGAGPRVLATFIIPGVLFLLSASRHSRVLQSLAMATVVGYAAINVFLGVRHEAAALLMAFAWLWDRRIRPLNVPLVASCGAIILLVIFPLVAATRNSRGTDRASIAHLAEEFASIDNPVIAAIREMGGSMGTVAHTMTLVPATHEFEMGASYYYAFLTLFPNFFWELHPTIARKIPGAWLTWEVDPITAAEGGGLGYSFIAEAYLNFGWIGTPPLMILIGYLIGWAVRWADHHPRADRLAALATGACFFVFYVRAELAVILRGVAWYTCIPFIAVLLLTHAQYALRRRPVPLPSSVPQQSVICS